MILNYRQDHLSNSPVIRFPAGKLSHLIFCNDPCIHKARVCFRDLLEIPFLGGCKMLFKQPQRKSMINTAFWAQVALRRPFKKLQEPLRRPFERRKRTPKKTIFPFSCGILSCSQKKTYTLAPLLFYNHEKYDVLCLKRKSIDKKPFNRP